MMLIEPPSTSQRPACFGSLMSMVKCTCGFCHFHSETTPRYSTSFSISNIANEWCAATDADASAKAASARPTCLRILMNAPRINAERPLLLDLFRWNDGLLFDRISGIAPLLEGIAHRRSRGVEHRRTIEVIPVHMRLLITLRVVPGIGDRQPLAIRRQLEPLDEARLGSTDAPARHRTGREADGLDDQGVSLILPHRVTGWCRHPWHWMLTAVQVEVPDAAAFAGKDHFVVVLDEVHAARVG